MSTSSNNKNIKLAGALKEKKARDKEGLFVIEGPHLIEEALHAGFALKFLLFSKKASNKVVAAVEEMGFSTYLVDEKTMDSVSDTKTNQGLIAVVPKLAFSFDDIKTGKDTMILVCDGIQDPGNLGTMIRSCAGAGCGAVIISDDSVDPYNPKTIRSTGGSIFKLPVICEADIKKTVSYLKAKNIKVLCADASGDESLFECDLSGKTAFVVGSESKGVKKEVLKNCDAVVKIPMQKNVESLNAAVAASVMLFEGMRQRIV